eukprot:1160130-Pelagomonas_calceolata.AAC.2
MREIPRPMVMTAVWGGSAAQEPCAHHMRGKPADPLVYSRKGIFHCHPAPSSCVYVSCEPSSANSPSGVAFECMPSLAGTTQKECTTGRTVAQKLMIWTMQ